MKKILLLLIIGAVSCGSVRAQLAKWVMPPVYDSISVKVDKKIIETDSLGIKTLWTMDGGRLFETEHVVLPFKEGLATVVRKDNGLMTGFVDMSGKFTSLPDVRIAYDNPYFNDGYLIFQDNKGYGYYRPDGSIIRTVNVETSYPFHHGYAPYLAYGQPDKKKDPYYGYHTADGHTVRLRIYNNGDVTEFAREELVFLSGISSDGRGVAVIRGRLYWFNATDSTFEPMLRGEEGLPDRKRHLILEGDYGTYFLNLPSGGVEIRAVYGKKNTAILRFDKELVPVHFIFNDGEITFPEDSTVSVSYATSLSSYGHEGSFGLSMYSRQVLPEQFESVGLMYGDKAFVKLDGKWGIIEILPDLDFRISINKGRDIAFRHQTFETQMRLDLPAGISAKEARLDVPDSTGCILDKTSRVTKDTESGNFVLYDCTLDIPASLPDTITRISYSPVSLTYDGISMFGVPVQVRAWHLKYYNVDPIDSETTVDNGVASFTVNINAQRNVGEGDYPFEVRVEADSISVNYEKISETRYKCTVYNLKEGDNSLNIFVTEQGCPSAVFPFEITYTKPVPQKKEKEKVVIRKRTPAPKNVPSTPILEI